MKPVIMIDRTIEMVCRRNGSFSDFGSWAVGHEVVKEDPSPDMQFGRTPVTMEMTRSREPAVKWNHVTVNHVASAIGGRVIESQGEAVCMGTEFVNSVKGRAG